MRVYHLLVHIKLIHCAAGLLQQKAGIKKITTETGAGQWGTALAFACSLFDLECEVWQVGGSYDAKPYRRLMMEVFGANVHRSPSQLTEAGRKLALDPKITPVL